MNVGQLLEAIHGHLGVLAAAALLHPAILLWRGRPLSRGMGWAVGLSTTMTALAFGGGLVIYEAYRAEVKRRLFFESRMAGLLFETKEHLAYAVVALAVGGLVCALAAPRTDADLRRLAARLYAVAAVLGIVVVSLGTIVASFRTFAG